MPPEKDLRVAVENALAAHLSALEYGDPATPVFATVYAGWPEYSKTRDLGEGPIASVVVVGQPRMRLTAPEVEDRDPDNDEDDPPTTTILYNVGEWGPATVQITLWCEHKTQADEVLNDVRVSLQGTLYDPGLTLDLPDYYDGSCVLGDDSTERAPQERRDLEQSSWVATLDVQVFAHLLTEVTHARQDVIQLVTTTDVMGEPSTEATVTTTFEVD